MSENNISEAVEEIWREDLLGRKQDAEIIRRFTVGHLELREKAGEPRTYVLNLDANWGAGKSFFLMRFKNHLEAHGHISVYVNAWEDDHSNDPFMTVVDEVLTEISNQLEDKSALDQTLIKTEKLRKSALKVIGGAAWSGGRHFLTRYLGEKAVEELSKITLNDASSDIDSNSLNETLESAVQNFVDSGVNLAGEEILGHFRKQKEVQKNFRTTLEGVAKEVLAGRDVVPPIFVLIDELDRCRPSYAIELLERVKHIFSINNFVYILGTDTRQLANAVKGVYGSDFDGSRYLSRFIDRTYRFQKSSRGAFIDYVVNRNGIGDLNFYVLRDYNCNTFLAKIFNEINAEPRDIERIIEAIGTFVAAWPWDWSKRKIDLARLLPII